MNLEELQTARDRERQTDKLQQLRESFYADAGEFIRQLRTERARAAERASDPFDSPEVNRLTDQINTAEQSVEAIYEKRVGKIVKAASFAAADLPAEAEGMTAEEQELFENLVAEIKGNRQQVLDVLAGESDDPAAETVPTDSPENGTSLSAADLMGSGEQPTDSPGKDAETNDFPPESTTTEGEEGPVDADPRPPDEEYPVPPEASIAEQTDGQSKTDRTGRGSPDEGETAADAGPDKTDSTGRDSPGEGESADDGSPDGAESTDQGKPDWENSTDQDNPDHGDRADQDDPDEGGRSDNGNPEETCENADENGGSVQNNTVESTGGNPGDESLRNDGGPGVSPESRAARETQPDGRDGIAGDSEEMGSVSAGEKSTPGRRTVRITQDIDNFVGTDDREYDLDAQDVVTLPDLNATLLVERDAAEYL